MSPATILAQGCWTTRLSVFANDAFPLRIP